MTDAAPTNELEAPDPPVPSRLKKCRRLSHGLSRPPSVKNPNPLGDKAFLACPKDGEGICGYRRAYGCTDKVRNIALATGGVCVIEAVKCEALEKDLLRLLDYREGEEPGAQVQLAVAAFAEASIYWGRTIWRVADRIPGIVKTPSHEDAMRYQTAGVNAYVRRRRDMIVARIEELGLNLERIQADSGGRLWTWWLESRKARWMRSCYEKNAEAPKDEPPDPRAARLAQWKRWEERARQATKDPGPEGVR